MVNKGGQGGNGGNDTSGKTSGYGKNGTNANGGGGPWRKQQGDYAMEISMWFQPARAKPAYLILGIPLHSSQLRVNLYRNEAITTVNTSVHVSGGQHALCVFALIHIDAICVSIWRHHG